MMSEFEEFNVVRHIPAVDGCAEVILVGTSHSDENSAELLRDVIESSTPDIIALELCEERVSRNPNQISASYTKQAVIYFAHLLGRIRGLWNFEKIDDSGVEVEAAVSIAAKDTIPVALIDMPLSEAFGDFIEGATYKELLFRISGIRDTTPVKVTNEGDINQSDLQNHLEELKQFTAWDEAIIQKRDEVLSKNIETLQREDDIDTIVAQVGAGHLNQVEHNLRNPQNLQSNSNHSFEIRTFD